VHAQRVGGEYARDMPDALPAAERVGRVEADTHELAVCSLHDGLELPGREAIVVLESYGNADSRESRLDAPQGLDDLVGRRGVFGRIDNDADQRRANRVRSLDRSENRFSRQAPQPQLEPDSTTPGGTSEQRPIGGRERVERKVVPELDDLCAKLRRGLIELQCDHRPRRLEAFETDGTAESEGTEPPFEQRGTS